MVLDGRPLGAHFGIMDPSSQRNGVGRGHALGALAAAVLGSTLIPHPAVGQDDSAAGGRLLCQAPEARRFDFWIGDWNVVNRNRPPDGTGFFETGRATDRVYAVVGGCGIVEHWRGEAIGRFIVGFSIRAYDPTADEWTLALLWPTNGEPSFGELRGGFRHGRGEFSFRRVLPSGDTAVNRFTFSDIGPSSLRWENATSTDGGLSWVGNWIMEFTRRDPVADAALWNGPTVTTRRCRGEEHRRFDSHLGEWEGVRTDGGGDSTAVRAYIVPILEGCAIMERVSSEDGAWEAFRVRAYEPASDRWVEYAIESDRRVLRRREATREPVLVFRDVVAADGTLTRTTWSAEAEAGPRWRVEEAEGPRGPWRLRAVVRLDRPLADIPPR